LFESRSTYYYLTIMYKMDPTVWGPKYWFFLHTIAMSYPLNPNAVTKKKYYEFIQNLPLFIPNGRMGVEFGKMLDEYPVTPYLDSRASFVKWTHYVHNKVNEALDKPCISLDDFYTYYYELFKPVQHKTRDILIWKERAAYLFTLIVIMCIILYAI